MRNHKPPVGSLTWHLGKSGLLKEIIAPINKGLNIKELYYNLHAQGVISAYTCLARYEISRYFKHRPADILLDKSVLDFIESHPMEDKITMPDFHQLWVDLSKFGMTMPDDDGQTLEVNGILFVKPDSFGEGYYDTIFNTLMSSFSGGDQLYCAWIMCGSSMVQMPFGSDTTYDELLAVKPTMIQNMDPDWKSTAKNLGRYVAIAIMALQLIEGGHFTKESSVYQNRRLPFKEKIKSNGKKKGKGAKFKQRYREFRTTRFVHIDSEPNPKGSSTYTPPEHYTPRNVRSHYKERWVTLDYIEKYQVPDEDILDLEDRTRLYKNGEGTKLWGKIKLWYEYKQDPNLEPTQEIERYRV